MLDWCVWFADVMHDVGMLDTTTSPSRSSSGFRLEPPKLCSPLSCTC